MLFSISYKEKIGKDLDAEAKKIGIPFIDIRHTSEGYGATADAWLQERVRNARNLIFARRSWVIALVSAIASLVSAIAAWAAIIK